MSSPDPEWIFLGTLIVLLLAFHRARRAFWLFSVLVLPGTFAHEGSHFLLGLVLGGQPASVTLIPHREGQGWVLGSVTFQNLRWYNVFFIGLAPLLLLPAAYRLALWRLEAGPVLGWREALALYGIANLIYACVPSWHDLRMAARSPIGWLMLAGGLGGWFWFQGRSVPQGAPGQVAR